jgi:hypothetical protein
MKMNRGVSIEAPKIKGDENNPQNIIATVSKALQEQQVRTENMFRQLQGPQTGGDAFDQMTKMMAAMGTMMAGMGITPAAPVPAKTLVEQLTEFKMIKELFGGDESSAPGGDANLYSLMTETVKAFGGPIAQAIAAGAESGQLTPEGLAALPAPDTSVQITKAEQMTEQEKHNMVMRKNIHILIQNAKSKIPPEAFALVLVNNTPEERADDLFDFISAEDCVDTIIKLEPAAEVYREWFDGLRVAVIDLMTEPVEPDHPKPEPEIELQPGDDESSISESENVAGDKDEASLDEAASLGESESSGKSDGDTSVNT